MKGKKFLLAFSLLLASPLAAGTLLDVKNAEGKALKIDLIAVEGTNVVFSIPGKDAAKEHTLPLAKFDEASQTKLQEEGKTLPPRLPKLDIDIAIANRRDKEGYYMINQTVSAKVKFRNLSTLIPFPAAKAYMIYFGQDRRSQNTFKVMANKSFDFSIEANKSFETDVLGFKSRYDSDNKGVGNAGGYQYECYVLVITNTEGKVLLTKTTDGSLRMAMEKDIGKAERLTKLAESTVLNKELEPN